MALDGYAADSRLPHSRMIRGIAPDPFGSSERKHQGAPDQSSPGVAEEDCVAPGASIVAIAPVDKRPAVGSGFVVAPQWVITCAHVAHPEWGKFGRRWPHWLAPPELQVLCASGAVLDVDQVVPHEELAEGAEEPDWVALRTAVPFDVPPLPLLEGVTQSLLAPWSERLEGAHREGNLLVDSPNLKLLGQWFSRRVLTRGQVKGGAKVGASGSPVFVRKGEQAAAIGMFYLGGEGVPQSDFYGSDDLIRFLRQKGIQPAVIAGAAFLRESGLARAASSAAVKRVGGTRSLALWAGGIGALGAIMLATRASQDHDSPVAQSAGAAPSSSTIGNKANAPAVLGLPSALTGAVAPKMMPTATARAPSPRVVTEQRSEHAIVESTRARPPAGGFSAPGAANPPLPTATTEKAAVTIDLKDLTPRNGRLW